MGRYADAFAQARDDREAFWLDAAEGVDWVVPPTIALDESAAPIYRWFPGATLNLSLIHISEPTRPY